MKLLTILPDMIRRCLLVPLALSAYMLSAQSPSTEVRMPGGTMSYEKIFELVEKQGHVWFGYAEQNLDVKRTVSIPAGQYTIGELLDWLFDGTAYKYTFSGRHILISKGDAPQERVEQESFTTRTYAPAQTHLPYVAIKSNLLYDATATVNIGVEVALAQRWTIDIPFNYNGWKLGDTRFLHWGFQPEVRYWTCQRFDGWFFGLHGHYAKFNIGAFPDRSFISENMRQNRYEGHLYGAGLAAGYSWILGKRWSMEAAIGMGYARIVYDKYPCAECGSRSASKAKDFWGPTKAGLSIVFMIN